MTKLSNRRSLIKKALVAAAVAGASTIPSLTKADDEKNKAPVIKKNKIRWKMIMTWQKVLPGLGTGAVRLAKRITDLSDGRLEVKVYGGGELVPPLGVFDAVSLGVAEMGHTSPYYWLSKSKASAFFCAVPGGLTAQEQSGWIRFGGGQELWDELYAGFGLKSFMAGNTGTQMGGWYNRELKSINDLKGLKIRMPGLAGQVINKLGGTSVNISPQELFTSIQSGVIDALEWIGPWNDMALGFHRVAKYYYGPAFHEPGPSLELMVNKEAYEKLPADLQNIVKEACAAECELMTAEFHANNIKAFNTLKEKHHVDIRVFPDDILKAFFEKSEEVVAEVAKESPLAKKIFDSYYDYRKLSKDYNPFSEMGYMKARLGI